MSKRKQSKSDPMSAAREVARAEVARRWPELADVEPTVKPRQQHTPEAVGSGRLGSAAGPAPARPPAKEAAEQAEYTFTFAGHMHTPDGYLLPRIARVTVGADRRVVKATTSK
jgi:hypothetical protein